MTNTMKLKNKKGFTLTELIVVIVIIGILAAVLIPSLTGYIEKAKKNAVEQEASQISTVFSTYIVETEESNIAIAGFKTYVTSVMPNAVTDNIMSVSKDGFVYCNGKYGVEYKKATGFEAVKKCGHTSEHSA